MNTVTLLRKKEFPPVIPYHLLVNDKVIGIMKGERFTIHFPQGRFKLSVKMRFQILRYRFDIGSDKDLEFGGSLEDGVMPKEMTLLIQDREKWWNLVFNIDLVLWLISFFVDFPEPWGGYYDMVSEGFFIVWIIRNILISNRYFSLKEIT